MAPRALRRGVADAEVRCERRFAGDDMIAMVCTEAIEGVEVVKRGRRNEGEQNAPSPYATRSIIDRVGLARTTKITPPANEFRQTTNRRTAATEEK